MARKATPEAKLMREIKANFPILYDDGRVRVYKNPTNEIFVEDIRSRVTMRINSYSCPDEDGGLQFTTVGRVEPVRVHGTIGWRVSPR